MSKNIKTFNLKEGAFPIKMDLMFEDIDLQNIGRLKDSICGNIEIITLSATKLPTTNKYEAIKGGNAKNLILTLIKLH